jgi:hypothetical protein
VCREVGAIWGTGPTAQRTQVAAASSCCLKLLPSWHAANAPAGGFASWWAVCLRVLLLQLQLQLVNDVITCRVLQQLVPTHTRTQLVSPFCALLVTWC